MATKMSCPTELRFFLDYEDDVITNFVAIAIEHISNNVKSKSYSSAANKLGTDAATIEHVISKLVYVLLESIKLQLPQSEFLLCCEDILPLPKATIIWDGLNNQREKLTEALSMMGVNYPHYCSLDWRLECMVNSIFVQTSQVMLITHLFSDCLKNVKK